MSQLHTYAFTVRIAGQTLEDLNGLAEELHETIEIYPSETDGETDLQIYAQASNAREALAMTRQALHEATTQVEIIRIDLDLVPIAEIAERAGVSRETARLWVTGKRRQGFPASFATAGPSKLWAWSEVFDWLEGQGLNIAETYGDFPLGVALIESFNGSCARHRPRLRDDITISQKWMAPIQFGALTRPRGNVIAFQTLVASRSIRLGRTVEMKSA